MVSKALKKNITDALGLALYKLERVSAGDEEFVVSYVRVISPTSIRVRLLAAGKPPVYLAITVREEA